MGSTPITTGTLLPLCLSHSPFESLKKFENLTSKRDYDRDEVENIKMGILSNGTDKVDHRTHTRNFSISTPYATELLYEAKGRPDKSYMTIRDHKILRPSFSVLSCWEAQGKSLLDVPSPKLLWSE
ncbi:hypothetical protein BO83DRAFT_416078 [Aspergillus eucalypticola CBS 122712]|uniref:Uncharacterized protein n=1 Tax=Aspergillus eucalypticola (strain CBS 122712 / IBT 29274) TaxID=1448314 RepID=A0A317VV78_ASPEC|nr:uncharacterized protein BO83DRAFT_416078 [Aspergillus eucalypticola CBS 122712]PWY76758.1 hypothetical protein BO83DRAFT_416078 [Aspergillus eucalypticola CBS 122712]